MFFQEILKFFDDPKSLFPTLDLFYSAPVLPDCKDTNLFNFTKFLFQKILKFFKIFTHL